MDSVHNNGFSVGVISNNDFVERVVYKGSNYFSLPHNTEYKIQLTNDHNVRVDADVWVDGEKAGVWRINPYSRITIERPVNVSRKFTLVREGSKEARIGGIRPGDFNNGVIKVTFRPEHKRDYHEQVYLSYSDPTLFHNECQDYTDGVTPNHMNHRQCALKSSEYINTYSSGATVLGDESNQRFRNTLPLDSIDYTMITTVAIRLIVDDDRSAYRRSYIGMRDANNISRVPPRIDLRHPSRPHECHIDSNFTLSNKYWFDNF